VKKPLIIVESPTKARTIKKFLPARYAVKASVGHVRDLPKSTLGVDVENDFAPRYLTIKGKGEIIKELRGAVKSASDVYLATDPDREGEAIAWHLAELLKLPDPKRIELHEITKEAAMAALKDPHHIDLDRVNRRGEFSTAWSATKSRRCCGRRCAAGSRPGACNRSPSS
jgi:DNA topoisomerase I